MKSISPATLNAKLQQETDVVLIDVRSASEYAHVHVPGTQLLPLSEIRRSSVLPLVGSTEKPFYLLCFTGTRAWLASERLETDGFDNAIVVEGGTRAWQQAGLPVERGRGSFDLERPLNIGAGLLGLVGVVLGTAVHSGFFALTAAGLLLAGGLWYQRRLTIDATLSSSALLQR